MNDDFDIERILDGEQAFKPITKGLGFHHSVKEKQEVKRSLKASSIEQRRASLAQELQQRQAAPVVEDRGELAAFYNQSAASETSFSLEPIQEEAPIEYEQATLLRRFFAWSVDTSLITVFVLASAALSLVVNGISIASLEQFNLFSTKILLGSSIALFYLFYFSFLDTVNNGSFGKKVFGCELVVTSGEQLSLVHSFSRALFSLFSLASLGLFAIAKIDSFLTGTTIERR